MSKDKKDIIHGSWKRKITSSDLIEERLKCDFDKKEAISKLVDPAWLQQMLDLKWVQSDPVLRNSHKFYDMTREEMIKT